MVKGEKHETNLKLPRLRLRVIEFDWIYRKRVIYVFLCNFSAAQMDDDDDDDDRIYKENVVVILIPNTAWKSERWLPVRVTLCVLWINVVNVQNEIYETE